MRRTMRIALCFLIVTTVRISVVTASDWAMVTELQLRWVTFGIEQAAYGEPQDPLASFPNPICVLFGASYEMMQSDLLTVYPQFGVLLGGAQYTIENTETSEIVTEGAIGGGAFVRAYIGIGQKDVHALVMPELSYLRMKSSDTRYSLLELSTGIGIGFWFEGLQFGIEAVRVGFRPGGGRLVFFSFYPGFILHIQ